jgi:hypothetical protein
LNTPHTQLTLNIVRERNDEIVARAPGFGRRMWTIFFRSEESNFPAVATIQIVGRNEGSIAPSDGPFPTNRPGCGLAAKRRNKTIAPYGLVHRMGLRIADAGWKMSSPA